MALSRWSDKLLLVCFLAGWLIIFTRHVKEAFRTGLAQPAVFVTNSPDAESYPEVGGFRPEQGGKVPGLEIGDRLIRAGDVDLRGVGNIAFDAIAIEQAGSALRVPLELERDGRREVMTLELSRLSVPWMRIPVLVAVVVMAALVLVRAPPGAQPQMFFITFMGLAILQSPFHGGSYAQTYLSKLTFYSLNIVVPPLLLRWILFFPPEAPRPGPRLLLLPWLALLAGAFVRGHYFFGGALPQEVAPSVGPAWDGAIAFLLLGLLTYNYRRSDVIGRRRIKWFLYGCYLGLLPMALTLGMPIFDPDGMLYTEALVFPALTASAIPIGLLIAIVRHQLFDIDRLISATASYSLLGALLLAAVVTVIPPLAGAASASLGVDPQMGHFALSLALALVIVPAHKRLRPVIEQFLFPERRALEIGIERLLHGLSDSGSPQAIIEQIGEGLSELIRTEKCIIYGRSEDAFLPRFVRAEERPPPIELSHPLIAVLERRMAPVAAEGASGPRAARHLSPFERATLEELKVSVVAPIRGRAGLTAFLCLGGKRSGDIYTSTDVAWLAAVADKASTRLLRFESLDVAPLHQEEETAAREHLAARKLQPSPLPEREMFGETSAALSEPRGSECPRCGTCYDSGAYQCQSDGVRLARLPVPRALSHRYRLVRRLGSGGMGTVYEATDTALERWVAVKLVREELAGSPGAAERFRREARATAAFTHPNVVTVHDFGVCSGLHPFLVMELLKGHSLDEELKREGRMRGERIIEILQSVCAAVGAAHEQRIIHRDLKPANIFLTKPSQGGVKVLDFGLAKFLFTSGGEMETHSGVLVGTVHYMAPERLEGAEAEPGWDIWGLGVIVYEMLTGTRPFEGNSIAACQTRILSTKFPPVTSYIPAAPSRWQAFFERALARDRSERPPTAGAFCAELESALA